MSFSCNYSHKNLQEFFGKKGVSFVGAAYSSDDIGIGAFDFLFHRFIKYLIDSSIATDYQLLEGGPQVFVSELPNKHGFIIDGKLVTVTPGYADLGHDEDEFRHLIDSMSVSGPENSAKEVISQLENFAASLADKENLVQLSEKHLKTHDVRPHRSSLY